jgi:hypothetical protein
MDSLPPLIVPEAVLSDSAALLRSFRGWRRHHEGIVYWAGMRAPSGWLVTTCIKPEAITTVGSFRTSAEANARVIAFLATHELELFAQVHSHPGVVVTHSDGDVAGALMPYQGFFSIVVPSYARGALNLQECGVNRFRGGSFARVHPRQMRFELVTVPSMKEFA